MPYLLSKTGAVLSLEEALLLAKSQRQLWLCPGCHKSLVILNSGGVTRVEHVERDCNLPGISSDALTKSLSLSSFISQYWRVPDPATRTLLKVERVSAFLGESSSTPMALIQTYNFVGLLGLYVNSDSKFEDLLEFAKALGVTPLVVTLADFSWASIGQALSGESKECAVSSADGTLLPTQRMPGRYQLFDQCMEKNAITGQRKTGRSLVSENKKIEHFNSVGPLCAADYLEDALTVLRIIKAANWVYALIFHEKKGSIALGTSGLDEEWFDVRAVQVPNFWLRFFVITESLSEIGHAETADDLAYKLALQHADRLIPEDFQVVVHELSNHISPLLTELLDAGFLEHNGYQFTCVRPLQQKKTV